MESSRKKSLFIRKTVQEWVRTRDPIAGYVITGLRDTPISSAGFFDDWDRPRFLREETVDWNGPDVLFLIPTRRPPWVDGGNRPGWLDPHNHFVGQTFFRIGIHSEGGLEGGLTWKILDSSGNAIARGAEPPLLVEELTSVEVGQIPWQCEEPGSYELHVEFGSTKNAWKFHVEAKADFANWSLSDPRKLFGKADFGEGPNQIFVDHTEGLIELLNEGGQALVFLSTQGTSQMPFWRESAYDFASAAPFTEQWERLLGVSGDSALDPAFLAVILPTEAHREILINRVDVRTYAEAPVMVRVNSSKGKAIITSLRPHGGLGIQPSGIAKNAAGCALIRNMMDLLK